MREPTQEEATMKNCPVWVTLLDRKFVRCSDLRRRVRSIRWEKAGRSYTRTLKTNLDQDRRMERGSKRRKNRVWR